MPAPFSTSGKQYAESAPDYCMGVNKNRSDEIKELGKKYITWFVEDSGFAKKEGSICALKGSEMPEYLTDFANCELFITAAAPEGLTGVWDAINNDSEVGTWQGDAYVNLSPAYHEALPDLYSMFGNSPEELQAKIDELSGQDKLKNAFSLNISIGKLLYINRKVSMNFNLNINNVLNNRNVVTYAYQQGRLDTKNYDRNAYPNRFSYAQGFRMYLNIGIRF